MEIIAILVAFAVCVGALLFIVSRSKGGAKLPSFFERLDHTGASDEDDGIDTVGGDAIIIRQIEIDENGYARTLDKHKVALPVKVHQRVAIVPPRGTAEPGATGVITLSKTSTINTVSHSEPLAIYKGNDKLYYIKANPLNLNKTRFMGEVVDEIPLANVLSTRSDCKVLYVGNEPLVFEWVSKKKAPTTVILDENVNNKQGEQQDAHKPAKKASSMGNYKN